MTAALALALLALPAAAQEGAAFLKIGAGARAAGLAGAYTALADDASAIAWNPAGLSALPKRELSAMHAELFEGARYDFLSFAQPTRWGTLAAGAVRLGQAAIEGRDASGRPAGSFGASDDAVQLAYARGLGHGARMGAGLKYISSAIADASARTFALDLGGQYRLGSRGPGTPIAGVALRNLGPGLRYLDRRDPLPLTLAAGLGYVLPAGLTLAAEYGQRPSSGRSELGAGMEYAVLSGFALRAGYGTALAGTAGVPGAGRLAGLAAGFGLRAYGYSLDYAMTPMGELGRAQRFSLGARF